MQQNLLQFDFSPWLIIVCLLLAAGGTYLLYGKDTKWGKVLHYSLIGMRFVCLFILALLLLGPILNQVKNTIEKPTWVIALDNSTSIIEAVDSVALYATISQIIELKKDFESNDYIVDFRSFDSKIEESQDIQFDQPVTNLNTFIKEVNSSYEGRNLAGLVLVSDGIYNQGISPLFTKYQFPIHTIGIGDTTLQKDLYIQELKYNKISYQGNDFPIAATIGNKGYVGRANLVLAQNGKVITTKSIELKSNQPIHQVEFLVEATNSGLQKYSVSISEQSAENNISNNIKSAYIDIIEGKERILLIASAPHPDIKAIGKSINTKNNYELITYIPSIGQSPPEGKFDLVIYHGLPDRSQLYAQSIRATYAKNVPYLIISRIPKDYRRLNNSTDYLSIKKLGNDNDKVTASINVDFTNFTLSDNLRDLLPSLPPLEVPYADIDVSQGSSTLLYQQLGSVVTENPMLQLSTTGEIRSAIFIGEGIWRWRLHEYNLRGNNEGFDELMLKLIQYLSTKVDKRKFKCSPIKNEVTTNETVVFETEIYNDLYELVFDKEIDLTLTNREGESLKYNYVNAKDNSRYKINGLSDGIYQYRATTNIEGKSQSVSGELLISEQQIESLNTTANFDLLSKLALRNNGTFHSARQFPTKDQLESNPSKGVIHSAETFDSLINFEWLFVFLILLLGIEWFSRKYNGAY